MGAFERQEVNSIAAELNAGDTVGASNMLREEYARLQGNPGQFMKEVALAQQKETHLAGTAQIQVLTQPNGMTDVSVVGPVPEVIPQTGQPAIDQFGRPVLVQGQQEVAAVPPPPGYVMPQPGVVVEQPGYAVAPPPVVVNPWVGVVDGLFIGTAIGIGIGLGRPPVVYERAPHYFRWHK